MALHKILEYSWFTDQFDAEDIELFESNFKNSKRTQEALVIWIDHELDKLDKEFTLPKLRDVADRAEVALFIAAQRDALLKLKSLLLED